MHIDFILTIKRSIMYLKICTSMCIDFILQNIVKYFIDLFLLKQSQYAILMNILKYSIDLFLLKQISREVCYNIDNYTN